jgi:arginine-tRNA-protein transferase
MAAYCYRLMPGDPEQLACPYPNLPPPVDVRLVVLPAHDCSYLPNRTAVSRALYASRISPELYHDFLDAGFRRSGRLVYQPVCRGCRRCVPIRVPVAGFRPNKSQRRCARRNADLHVTQSEPSLTDEKFLLYRRYVEQWHGKPPDEEARGRGGDDERDSLESFLYDSPVNTIEFEYRDEVGRLLGVGICDRSVRSLSSVYFYFEPSESRRGLGTFGALHEIAVARSLGIPFYYLGYWIDGCGAMEYKANFRPNEILSPTGRWYNPSDGCNMEPLS